MGAAASSEAALRAAVATAINPPAHGKRLPRDARRWKISHVSLWLRQNELHALVDVFKNHCIDGQMLLEDCRDEDFDSIIPFVPLRRKFRRCLEALAHQSSHTLADPDSFGTLELHQGLRQLNETMQILVTVLMEAPEYALPRSRVSQSPLQDQRNRGIVLQKPVAAYSEPSSFAVQPKSSTSSGRNPNKTKQDPVQRDLSLLPRIDVSAGAAGVVLGAFVSQAVLVGGPPKPGLTVQAQEKLESDEEKQEDSTTIKGIPLEDSALAQADHQSESEEEKNEERNEQKEKEDQEREIQIANQRKREERNRKKQEKEAAALLKAQKKERQARK